MYGSSVQSMDAQLGARPRRWTLTIHRGSGQRTIAFRPTVVSSRGANGRRLRDRRSRRMGGSGDPCPNQRNKSERKENIRQPQLCSMPGRGHCRALPGGSAGPRPPEDRLPYRGSYVRRTYLGLIPWLVLAPRLRSEVPSSRADHISSGLVRGSHRAALLHRLG